MEAHTNLERPTKTGAIEYVGQSEYVVPIDRKS
jgi:hypothetical protein